MVHAVPERDRALRESGGVLGLVGREHAGEAAQRGNEALEVRGCLRLRDRLLVGRPGDGPVATLAVDLAQLLERVRDHTRPEPAVDLACVLEVGDGFLEAPEPRPRLSAIRERERPEGGEAGEIGEPKAEVELGDCLLVRAFLRCREPRFVRTRMSWSTSPARSA